jgi:hypothetical protein
MLLRGYKVSDIIPTKGETERNYLRCPEMNHMFHTKQTGIPWPSTKEHDSQHTKENRSHPQLSSNKYGRDYLNVGTFVSDYVMVTIPLVPIKNHYFSLKLLNKIKDSFPKFMPRFAGLSSHMWLKGLAY